MAGDAAATSACCYARCKVYDNSVLCDGRTCPKPKAMAVPRHRFPLMANPGFGCMIAEFIEVSGYANKLFITQDGVNDLNHLQQHDEGSSIARFQALANCLRSLLNYNDDGRIIVAQQKPGGQPEDAYIKFVMLCAEKTFSEVTDDAHAVIMAGGTLQPIEETSPDDMELMETIKHIGNYTSRDDKSFISYDECKLEPGFGILRKCNRSGQEYYENLCMKAVNQSIGSWEFNLRLRAAYDDNDDGGSDNPPKEKIVKQEV
ncbi:hypothetical protein ACQ4PT_060731 [Festuca glaucescens]